MDYKFFTDMMKAEVNKQPSPDLKIGRKIEEKEKEKKDEAPLADITKVDKEGKGPSIDNVQPEAPEQKGESTEEDADQIKSLKDNDKKDQVTPEVVEDPKKKKNEAVINEQTPLAGKSEEDKEATAAGEEPPAEEPAPEAPKDDMGGGKPPKPKGEEDEVPEEPATEEPKKKVTLGQSADQFFYFQPNEQGGVILDAEEKELKKINPGPILPQILDIVRELKIDLIGAQFVTDYILPEVEAKNKDMDKAKEELEPKKEELPTEPEPTNEELPVPPAVPNESANQKDFLTALYESQEVIL